MTVNDLLQAHEAATLRKVAGAVISWLVLIVLASIILGVELLSRAAPDRYSIWLCVLGGTLGSGISALTSAAERISNGWEFTNGAKYPDPEPKDKFVARMVPFFIIRPFLGSAMGLLVYVGLSGGYLIAVKDAKPDSFSPEGLLFLALLGGLFAKTFIEKLRSMFDTLFGKSK